MSTAAAPCTAESLQTRQKSKGRALVVTLRTPEKEEPERVESLAKVLARLASSDRRTHE